MLAPGSLLAAAEQQHLRDPVCNVPVTREATERPETTRPAELFKTLLDLLNPGVKEVCEDRHFPLRGRQKLSS